MIRGSMQTFANGLRLWSGTWLAVCVVTSASIYTFTGGLPQGMHPSWYRCGWPVLFAFRTGPWLEPTLVFISTPYLLFDVLICATAICSAGIIVERWHRLPGQRLQFQLATALATVAVVAAVLAVGQLERNHYVPQVARHFESALPVDVAGQDTQDSHQRLQPLAIRMPLYFGTGCFFYLVLAAARRARYAATRAS